MLTVLHVHSSAGLDGSERQMLTLLSGLNRSRFRRVVACPAGGHLKAELQKLGVIVYTVPLTTLFDVESLIRLVRIIRLERVKIIHTHLSPADSLGLLAAILAGVSVRFFTKHSLRPSYIFHSSKLMRAIAQYVSNRFVVKRSTAVIAVSNAVRESLIENEGFPPSKVHTIYNGIEAGHCQQLITSADARRILGLPMQSQLILCPARLSPEKGQEHLLNAFKAIRSSYPHARLLLAGDGPSRDELLEQANALQIADATRFLGNRSDIPLLLAASNIVVLPSVFEGFGLAVVEAMCAARPVVCTSGGGPAEIVKDGDTGFVVAPACPQSLKRAISRLLSDPVRAAAMGHSGKIVAQKRFSARRMVAETEELYDYFSEKNEVVS